MNLLIYIFTFLLIIVSVLLVLVVLAQKAKSDGGVAAMGGGAAESAFGAETNNVLVGTTKTLVISFFIISFGLYLAHLYQSKHQATVDSKLPTVVAPATPAQPAPTAAPTQTPASTPAPAK